MSVDDILKKEGITIIRKLDFLEINRIAKNISDKISKSFSDYLLNRKDLFSLISRIDMYLAKMPADSSSAKYLYKNNSIYFNENIDLLVSENSIFALHECIHFLQAQKDSSNKLTRLGLYKLGKYGVAINEAAVQLMASIAQGVDSDLCKYYDIYINTISPDCYPLQCALLSEMLYFTDTYPLYQSTLNSNDIFKNTFISYSDKKTYEKIESNLDKLLKLEDDLFYFSIGLSNATKEKDSKSLKRLVDNRKKAIRSVFFNTQNLIIQSCFTKQYNNISNLEDVKELKNKLYNFKDVLGYSDDYNFYNDFYCNTMMALDTVRNILESGGNIDEYKNSNKSIAIIDNSLSFIKLFKSLIQKIKKIFSINKNSVEEIWQQTNKH